jgi:HK97 family phage portal protein
VSSAHPQHIVTRAVSRVADGLKAFTMRFQGRVSSWSSFLLPNTRIDYGRYVGDGMSSSLVVACLFWVGRTFPEAPIRVQRREADATLTPLHDHALTDLIASPNPYYSGELLMMATAIDLWANGNAYWLKNPSRAGRTVELWWTPSSLVEPKWPDDGTEFISHYAYKPDPMKDAVRVEPDQLVHFRFGLDPSNPRKGYSPLQTLLREIFTDDEAANYTAALLRNFAVPGVIISPKPDSNGNYSGTDEDAESVKVAFKQKFGGDNRGEPMVMLSATQVDVVGFSPQQMNLKELRRIPEERVSAVLGIPAIVAGLGAGLDRSTFSNMAEAREAAYESAIIPMQRIMAGEIRRQLLRDFGDIGNLIVDFDYSKVRVLQEDETARVTRMNAQLASGAITVAEYRSALGYPTDPSHDIYLRGISVIEVPVGMAGQTFSITDAPNQPLALPKAATVPHVKSSREQQYIAHVERSTRVVTRQAQRELQTAFRAIAADVVANIEALKAREPVLVTANGHGDVKLSVPSWLANMNPATVVPAGTASDRIAGVFRSMGERIGGFISGAVSTLVGRDVTASDAVTQFAIARAHAFDADAKAREAVAAALSDGQAAGDTLEQMTTRIGQYVAAGHQYPGIADEQGIAAAVAYRAETIALTEEATIRAVATADVCRSAGVLHVLISDGDGCGWTAHDDSDLADGTVRTVEDYAANPLAHPRCVRTAVPYLEAA